MWPLNTASHLNHCLLPRSVTGCGEKAAGVCRRLLLLMYVQGQWRKSMPTLRISSCRLRYVLRPKPLRGHWGGGPARSWMQGWENTREVPGAVGATWTTQSHHHLKFCLLQEVLQDQVPRSQNPWKFLKCRFQGPDLSLLGQHRKASQGYHICDNTGGLGLSPLSGNSGHCV